MKKRIISFLLVMALMLSMASVVTIEAEAATEFQPIWPVSNGYVKSLDYYPGGSFHNGIDITPTSSTYKYQDIYSIASGTVIEARNSCSHETYNANHACPDTWGNYIIIKHTVGGVTYHSTYAHLKYNSLKVSVGDTVAAGQTIAQMGTSGGSTGHHLHLEIWRGKRSDRNQNIISRSFDYYVDNTALPNGLKIQKELASTSRAYASWIKNNCTRQGDYYVLQKNSVISQNYPTYCIIEATAGTSAMSMPCSTATNPDSSYLEPIGTGSLLLATKLVLNSAGNYWYKVELDGYDEAYVPASKMEFSWPEDDDVSISGVSAPQSLTEGSRFSIKGTITSTYNQLSHVSAYVYRGNTTSGTPVTGGRDTVSGNSYSLLNSDIDMDVLFNELSPGTYTYVVRAGYVGYYASSETTRGNYSGEIILHSNTFQVTGPGGTSPSTYTVSFHANGGSGAPSSITVNRNETVTIPDQFPTRWGYTFRGWSESPDGALDYLRGDSVDATGNVTLYAVWEDISVTVGDGHGFNQIVEFPGQGVWATFVPEYSGVYVIEGLSTADTKAVLYDSNGNVLEENDDCNGRNQFHIEQRLTAGETYHVFARFFSSNETGYLSWGITHTRQYTITYYNHDLCESTQSTHAAQSTVMLPSAPPSVVGYNFLFWEASDGNRYRLGDTVVLTEDLLLTSIWETDTKTFTATLMDFAPIDRAGFGWYVMLRPQASGYYGIFGMSDEDTVGTLYDANGSVIKSNDDHGGSQQFLIDCNLNAGETYYLYVRYYDTSKTGRIYYGIGSEITVSYDANGGSGVPTTQRLYRGQMVQLSTTVPVRAGYTFAGWSLDKTYAGQSLYQPGDAVEPGGSIVLYAVWDHTCSYVLQSSTPATCTTAGKNYYVCSLCGVGRTESIPATGVHIDADGDWEYNSTQHYHRCDCGASFDYTSHQFTNGCDTSCNTCGYTRTVTHVYANACDTSCNICGATRTTSHSWNSGTVIKQPTCAETGVKTFTCTVCRQTKTESIAKLSTHTYDNACDTSCNICGATRTTSHSWNSGTVTKQPTCAENGVKTFTCTVCRVTKTETLSKTNSHSYDTDWVMNGSEHWHECSVCGRKKDSAAHTPGAAATETTAQTCTACGYVMQEALGHTHQYDERWESNSNKHWHVCACGQKTDEAAHNWNSGEVTTVPSCLQTGVKTYRCTVCDTEKTEVIPPVGHNYNAEVTQPTCTEQGYTTYTCSACGENYKADYVAMKGHEEVIDASVAATCTDSGLSEGKHCAVCQMVLVAQNVIPAKGHVDESKDFVCDTCEEDLCAVHVEQIVPGTAATCEQSGLSEGKKCANCGEILVAQVEIPALNHSYGAWTEVKAPTAEQTGLEERVCTSCGEKEQREVAKLEPTPTAPTEPETQPTEPTEPGTLPTEPVQTEPKQPVPATTGTDAERPQDDSNTITVLIAVIAALSGIVIGGIVALIVLKKKK